MEIRCSGCEKRFVLPEEKIPQVPEFAVKCPGCGEKIVVEQQMEKDNSTQVPPGETIEPDFFPPGSSVAFIFIPEQDIYSRISGILEQKNYYISTARDIREGVLKLRLNEYQVIILRDEEQFFPLLEEVNSWPGRKRRDVNCILIGSSAPSMHQQEAFYRGVNFYLNIDDKDKIDELLEQVLKGFSDYNEPWRMALTMDM